MKVIILLLLICLTATAGHYSLDEQEPSIRTFTISLSGRTLAIKTLSYQQGQSDKLAVTIHGYLVNCGYMKIIHQRLLKLGYHVLCLEMPGHGLSEGGRFLIEDFKDYQSFLNQILDKVNLDYKKKVLLTHSAGSLGVLMNIFENKQLPFDHIFLIAPLIRIYKYSWAKFAYQVAHYFLDNVPRTKKDFQNELDEIHAKDPYFPTKTPVPWVGKMIDWNDKIGEQLGESKQKNITIIFAGKDKVVDSDYNLEYLKKRIPQAEFHLLPQGTHYPFYDLKIRDKFFNILSSKL